MELEVTVDDSEYSVSDIIRITVGELIISLEQINGETPSNFELLQNYPNPFNQWTTIPFNLHRQVK